MDAIVVRKCVVDGALFCILAAGGGILDSPPAEFCFTTTFCDQYYFFHPIAQEEHTRYPVAVA